MAVNNKSSFTVDRTEQGVLRRDIDTLTRLAISENPRTRDSNLQPSFLLKDDIHESACISQRSCLRKHKPLFVTHATRVLAWQKEGTARNRHIFFIASLDFVRKPDTRTDETSPSLLVPVKRFNEKSSVYNEQSLRKVRESAEFIATIRTRLTADSSYRSPQPSFQSFPGKAFTLQGHCSYGRYDDLHAS